MTVRRDREGVVAGCGSEDSRLGSSAWLQHICRSGHNLRESASASVEVVLGSGCCVWWPVEGSSVNCACVFVACGEVRQVSDGGREA